MLHHLPWVVEWEQLQLEEAHSAGCPKPQPIRSSPIDCPLLLLIGSLRANWGLYSVLEG
jgi:hypothetical protein